MRLLHNRTLQFREFYDSDIPEYAILSHKWEDNEVSYQEFQSDSNRDGTGYAKILNCCSFAKLAGYDWVWIDTCCIDKSSSAELSEAINSMFRWYKRAEICYAYISDYTEDDFAERLLLKPGFQASAWFGRGWTLQELLAPSDVLFLDSRWQAIGRRELLAKDLSCATGIDEQFLLSPDWSRNASVATKMSWASRRETSRVEDMAYCLMGLFDVNMPLLYGEGRKAFLRLQLEIIKISDDESIFAWKSERTCSGLLAEWPSAFSDSGNIHPGVLYHSEDRWPYTMTNRGLELTVPNTVADSDAIVRFPLYCRDEKQQNIVALKLQKSKGRLWYRIYCSSLPIMTQEDAVICRKPWWHPETKVIYVGQYNVPENIEGNENDND